MEIYVELWIVALISHYRNPCARLECILFTSTFLAIMNLKDWWIISIEHYGLYVCFLKI